MRVSNFDPANISDPVDFQRIVSIVLRDLVLIVNGGLQFSDNFQSKILTVEFTTANTEVRVDHNLSRIPTGYLVLKLSAAAIIYDGSTANTNQNAFLKASAPCTALVMLF